MDFWDYSLREMLSSDVCNFSEEHLIVLVYNLLCAINYLHNVNVIHRDIKPSNIMVTVDCCVRICDFGFARSYDKTNLKAREISPVAYSRWYRPPEIILCSDYDNKADNWSLGCVITELVNKIANKKQKDSHKNSNILFPGKSCYPISPSTEISP